MTSEAQWLSERKLRAFPLALDLMTKWCRLCFCVPAGPQPHHRVQSARLLLPVLRPHLAAALQQPEDRLQPLHPLRRGADQLAAARLRPRPRHQCVHVWRNAFVFKSIKVCKIMILRRKNSEVYFWCFCRVKGSDDESTELDRLLLSSAAFKTVQMFKKFKLKPIKW